MSSTFPIPIQYGGRHPKVCNLFCIFFNVITKYLYLQNTLNAYLSYSKLILGLVKIEKKIMDHYKVSLGFHDHPLSQQVLYAHTQKDENIYINNTLLF